MEKYNYSRAVLLAVKEWVNDQKNDLVEQIIEDNHIFEDKPINWEGINEDLQNLLWYEESVTGNETTPYIEDNNQAKKYVLDNFDLLKNIGREEFVKYEEIGFLICEQNFKKLDMILRRYFLEDAVNSVLPEIKKFQKSIDLY